MTIWEAIILAIVEGLTEFLPVSSTGHMIIVSSILGISQLDFTKLFTVNIQFGAILAVVVLYWRRFLQSTDFYIKLFAAFLPSAIIGFLLNDFIDSLLESAVVVATMLIVGGVILLYIDKWLNKIPSDEEINIPKAVKIGLFQCIAMIPGVSRSAATIIGGMLQGLSKKTAAEFSFFLAVPTMLAASAYKLLKTYKTIQQSDLTTLLIGNVVAFLVAMVAIKFFIKYLTEHGFRVFGIYRIIVGAIILAALAMGQSLQVV